MACCGGNKGIGHFGSYLPVSSAQVMTVTGAVQGAGNATAGMHTQYAGARAGTSGMGRLGDDVIPGIPNMYLWIFGGVLAVILISRG